MIIDYFQRDIEPVLRQKVLYSLADVFSVLFIIEDNKNSDRGPIPGVGRCKVSQKIQRK